MKRFARRCLVCATLAGLSAACASTGARPRPFPMPEAADRQPTAEQTEWARGLIATALEFRGAPYRNGGSTPAGFDCSGFTQFVFAKQGRSLPREVADQYTVGRSVRPDGARPGDLVFFTTVAPGASHVGLVIGRGEFVHAPSSRGVVRVERYDSSYWGPRLVGVRRIEPR